MKQPSLSTRTSLGWDLAILLAVWLAVTVLPRRSELRGSKSRAERAALWAILIGYLAVYAWLVLFYRRTFAASRAIPVPLRSYREAFSLEGGLHIVRLGLARQILLNILVYVPLGCVLPCLLWERRHPMRITLALGITLSVLTEFSQYFTRRGYCETDDLINNTLGCLLGMALFALSRAVLRPRDKDRSTGV